MRILLIAYEFPPSPSPRALRWRYLARELVLQGHDLHVLAPRLRGDSGTPESLSAAITMHHTFPGPLIGLVQMLASRRDRRGCSLANTSDGKNISVVGLNWKGRLIEGVKRVVDRILFPDTRAEWGPWARRAMLKLLRETQPDMIVVSHEPASTLLLGLQAGALGFPWVADLGDPIDAPYTRPRWKKRAAALEREVCRQASHLIVTTEAARQQLMQRHALAADRCTVLTQGFEDRELVQTDHNSQVDFDSARLELLYAGRFYDFRKPDELLEAVAALPNVRLTIVSPAVPAICLDYARSHPRQFRLLGALPHGPVLQLQASADVLVSIGNESMSAQIPGKLYEYLGTGRPILHLLSATQDAAQEFFALTDAGWTCNKDTEQIRACLVDMFERKRTGQLASRNPAAEPRIAQYGWSQIGLRLVRLLAPLVQNVKQTSPNFRWQKEH